MTINRVYYKKLNMSYTSSRIFLTDNDMKWVNINLKLSEKTAITKLILSLCERFTYAQVPLIWGESHGVRDMIKCRGDLPRGLECTINVPTNLKSRLIGYIQREARLRKPPQWQDCIGWVMTWATHSFSPFVGDAHGLPEFRALAIKDMEVITNKFRWSKRGLKDQCPWLKMQIIKSWDIKTHDIQFHVLTLLPSGRWGYVLAGSREAGICRGVTRSGNPIFDDHINRYGHLPALMRAGIYFREYGETAFNKGFLCDVVAIPKSIEVESLKLEIKRSWDGIALEDELEVPTEDAQDQTQVLSATQDPVQE